MLGISRLTPNVVQNVDNKIYQIYVKRTVMQAVDAPRLVIVAFQPNKLAQEILKSCIRAIQRYTLEPHELWVVDNNSPYENVRWLLDWPNINIVLNRTEPVPPGARGIRTRFFQWRKKRMGNISQPKWGSYANALGLELVTRLIEPESRYFMTLHMDTMPCQEGWLSFLQSKLCNRVAAVGVRMDRVRSPEGVLHVLGYLVDFQVFKQLQLDFFPELPGYDVGDRVTVMLRNAGYEVYACPNTMWNPELIHDIAPSSPFHQLHVDRAFDDEGNIIFLHLGRGVAQTLNKHIGQTTPQEWINFAETYLF